ncbi:hypothetical protein CTAYLR_006664 [Chrysophaeum taylorii]|uniref:ChrR-like cupin domain-containing protein n=1 Tax=Chrysophaeum taylorii TaxID=2483200 RepID=A0AAD7XP62_9STRA|nr:hypothetical protein CTAYLR_006664 [Chrysophaeum taylorii]
MRVHADFTQRAVVHGSKIEWVPSPTPGVDRRMLDRIGTESARATTIVRYEAGKKFPYHVHGGGEEFVVLDGVFSDQHGNFGAGYYVRNPPTSSHEPWSDEGCVILVKLHQFDLEDRTQVNIDTTKMRPVEPRDRDNVKVVPLFCDDAEDVRCETWAPRADIFLDVPKGGEFFVIDGSFEEGDALLEKWSWLRLPPGSKLNAKTGDAGAKLWVKTGHLPPDMARYEKFV